MLGTEVLVTRSPGYLLDIPRDAVDVHRFERIVREAGNEAPEQRAASLRKRSGSGVGLPWRTSSSRRDGRPKPPGSRKRAWPRGRIGSKRSSSSAASHR